MNPGDRTRLIVAIATNLAVGQVAASWLGLPRWAGTLAAGSAMAAATIPDQLPAPARGAVQLMVLPGNLVAQALDDQAERIEGKPDDAL
jgi:hypothetical protein